MSVSGITSSSPSDTTADARAILVAKKQQDVAKDQAQALLSLVQQATTPGVGQRINVYA
jgi:hypothetical protein